MRFGGRRTVVVHSWLLHHCCLTGVHSWRYDREQPSSADSYTGRTWLLERTTVSLLGSSHNGTTLKPSLCPPVAARGVVYIDRYIFGYLKIARQVASRNGACMQTCDPGLNTKVTVHHRKKEMAANNACRRHRIVKATKKLLPPSEAWPSGRTRRQSRRRQDDKLS
ncbi:hypothetical protein DFH06DRAFT_380206 [Mycena polygramma]|nr:hypothetical protein DFH06DRAFT_380206 [Mycena polygramma]